jgi:hypothetical protein
MKHVAAAIGLGLCACGDGTKVSEVLDSQPFDGDSNPVDTSNPQEDSEPEDTRPSETDAGPVRRSDIRLNEIQSIGTHNSYHILEGPPAHPAMDYQHAPLGEQLDAGVRHFELDIHREAGTGAILVYHVKSIDEASSCHDLRECLLQLRAWSDAHRDHHALVVILEPTDAIGRLVAESGGDPADTGELLWDGHIAEIDAILTEAWPDRLWTPKDLGRGGPVYARIEREGWPTVDETRGGLFVVINDTGAIRDEYRATVAENERAAFVFGAVGEPDVAFFKADNPRGDPDGMKAALEAGLILRTRADGDTEVDPEETAAAFASGAQLVSTDYAIARDDGAHPGYRLPWPGTPETPSRCNPVTARPECRDEDIE